MHTGATAARRRPTEQYLGVGPWHDRQVDETPSPFAVLVQAPGRFDGEELIEALAGIDAPGRVAPLRDFDEEATRRARELAADNLDASPTVIRREIAGFGRAYPRCSGMLATKRSSSTPPRRRSSRRRRHAGACAETHACSGRVRRRRHDGRG